MKTLETGQDKIQKICDKLRRDTLDPAKEEAQKIIIAARTRAEEIIAEGERHAQQLIKQARSQNEQEKNVFNSSLEQAARQAVEALRQEIENHLFNEQLQASIEKTTADPKVISQLLNGLVKAIEKEGITVDLTAVIPKTVSPNDINALLLTEVRQRLKEKPLEVGNFNGGAQVKLQGKRMTIDLSDQALKELLAQYARKDFRKIIFGR